MKILVKTISFSNTCRENRYLLFLTENYAALEILKQYLQDLEGEQLLNSKESTLKPWEMEPFVLFGSSFPRDKEYTQVSDILGFVYTFYSLLYTGM